ncbi:GDSL esterase/lipase At3g26430-like [Silene latifolia]|uniref:GDSL esterase/lipase At3g26430-like n=1 Tax=Silene latifolia TaxID=37657 RepID=UPI003D7804C0
MKSSRLLRSAKLGIIILTTLVLFATPNLCLERTTSQSVNDQVEECQFPAIFNFGDSNSDTGGLTALYGPAHPPNGITFFGGSAGRFCDGRLVIDFLAGSLGLPYLNAYLNSIGSNFSHGANFASAGATIRPQTTIYFPKDYSPISLNVQSAEFSTFHTRSQVVRNQGGFFETLPREDYFANALYTFDIGQNDLSTGYKLNMSTEQVKAIVPDVLALYAKTIRAVYAQGGRTFWIHNVGPMGCLPYMLDGYPLTDAQVDKFGCAIPINEAAQFYNAKLKELVEQLRKELSLAAFTYVDIYSIKYTLIARAEELGFEEPLVTCCGTGGKYNFDNSMRCGSTKIVDGKKIVVANSCKNPSIKVIWDGIHYTEAANKWIIDQILNNASYLDPPVSLKRACHVSGYQTPLFLS